MRDAWTPFLPPTPRSRIEEEMLLFNCFAGDGKEKLTPDDMLNAFRRIAGTRGQELSGSGQAPMYASLAVVRGGTGEQSEDGKTVRPVASLDMEADVGTDSEFPFSATTLDVNWLSIVERIVTGSERLTDELVEDVVDACRKELGYDSWVEGRGAGDGGVAVFGRCEGVGEAKGGTSISS